jgi:hypothetical protein
MVTVRVGSTASRDATAVVADPPPKMMYPEGLQT